MKSHMCGACDCDKEIVCFNILTMENLEHTDMQLNITDILVLRMNMLTFL